MCIRDRSQAAFGQPFLDLIERLAAKFGGLEQLVFGTLNQITDVIDILCLQTMGRTYGQFQVINPTQKQGINLDRVLMLDRQ